MKENHDFRAGMIDFTAKYGYIMDLTNTENNLIIEENHENICSKIIRQTRSAFGNF